MCEMISESCLVMVVIRQLRSFTSVPYYYESHSSPRAGLTRRPGPPSEIVDPAEFNGHPTADHGRLRGYPANLIAITSHTLDGEEQTTRAAGCDSYMPEPYSSRQLLAKKFSSACPNSCDRLLHRVMSLLAQSGHHDRRYLCPLSGVRRTSPEHALMSAFDPKRTSARPSSSKF
jgi:hypothetical protein